jgi:LPXTG-motif cell wall-anchored protein
MQRKIFSFLTLFILLNSSLTTSVTTVLAAEEGDFVQSDNIPETTNEPVGNVTESTTTESITLSSRSEEKSSERGLSTSSTVEPTISSIEQRKEEQKEESDGNVLPANSQQFSDALSDSLDDSQGDTEDISSWLPDPTLQSVIAKSLGIEVSEITKEKISQLQTIYIYSTDAALADLSGLEYATSLSSFYMSGTNKISDFSVLTKLGSLVYVYLMGSNVTDSNVPNFGENITRLDLVDASVTNDVYSKIIQMKNLESLSFESNMNITTIAPLASLPHLKDLRIQFCGVSDFTVINNFPVLEQLAAYGQNTGRNDDVTTIPARDLNYNAATQSFFVPFSIMPNRLTNFDRYVPPFSTSNSQSQTYFDLNGVQLPSSQLTITDEGITVFDITPEEFDDIQTMKYNSRLNNPAGTYAKPDGFSFYAISAGTYLHQFAINHQEVAADVTVEYVDTDGNEIHAPQVISGNVGDAYDATTSTYKLKIEGYTLATEELPNNGTGKLSDQSQTVTYVYTKDPVKAADVTVEYVDTDGNEIHASQVISGNVGDAYDATTSTYKLKIEGYTLATEQLPDNSTGKLSDQSQTVTYVYTKDSVKGADVTVEYVDTDGNEIHAPQVISGNVGDAYDATTSTYKLKIEGYTLATEQLPDNSTGKLSDQSQTVTYVYTKDPVKGADVTVKYVDTKGNEIHAPQVISGNVGDAYDATTSTYKLKIEGYTLATEQLPDNSTGKLSDQSQTVTYVYTKDPVKGADVTVKYVDTKGNEIHAPQVISGNVGDAYDATTSTYKLKIEGYTLATEQLPNNGTGKLSDEEQTVTYVYTKDPVKGADVTVEYVDTKGNEIHAPQVISGNVGDAYDATTSTYKLKIEGYTLATEELPDNSTGKLSDEEQTVTYVYTKDPVKGADVTVKYVDTKGNEIHAPQVISGNVGDAYDATTSTYKLKIEGYTLATEQLPDNSTGKLSDQSQTVTYVYTKDPVKGADVTVKYVDTKGNEIHAPQVISGNVGDAYDATTSTYKLKIEGYTLATEQLPNNGTGKLSDQEQTVTYVYTKDPVKAADVTVEYVDTDGNEIHAPQVISGNVGDAYDATTSTYKLKIEGYTLATEELPDNGTGKLSDQEQTVTYVYTKDPVKGADVTVKYVDTKGNEIHAPQVISGNVGDAYDATTSTYKLKIEGYTLATEQLPDNSTGKLSDQSQTVTYVYTKDPVKGADVTVKYVDTKGNEIHAPQVISGNVGDAYDATTSTYKLKIEGYTLATEELPDNGTGKLSDQEQTVTYVYTKDPVKAADVTVEYVDTDGNEIHAPQVISGNVGDAYDATTSTYKLKIEGYTLATEELPDNGTGKLSDQEQTVTYVYTKDPVKAADVTVEYVDTDGNKIHAPQVISGNVGDGYDTTTKDYQLAIKGYHLDVSQLPKNRTGILEKDSQTVTYVYVKDVSQTETSTSKQKNKKTISEKKKIAHQKESTSKELPQTNDVTNSYLNFIGIGLVGFIAFYFVKKRR